MGENFCGCAPTREISEKFFNHKNFRLYGSIRSGGISIGSVVGGAVEIGRSGVVCWSVVVADAVGSWVLVEITVV